MTAASTRIALTGACGYVGSRLSAALAAAGAEVHAFTRQRPALLPGGLSPELPGDQVLFHLASSVSPASAQQHPEWASADHDLFTRLLDRLAGLERPPLVVLASSGIYVYGPQARLPFGEGSPLGPRTAYGEAKLRLERELADRRDEVPGIVLRLANVYGPGQPARPGQGVIAHWLRAAREGSPLRLFGDPSTLRDFVYVDDVVAAMCRVAALASEPLPPVLNIGSGQATSLDHLLRVLACLVAGDLAVERAGSRGFDQYDAQLDISLAASTLGWTPRTALAAGLTRTWQELARQ